MVGGKWKAIILFHLKNGEKRFNELHKEILSISEMTLSLQLIQLEKDGLITQKVFDLMEQLYRGINSIQL